MQRTVKKSIIQTFIELGLKRLWTGFSLASICHRTEIPIVVKRFNLVVLDSHIMISDGGLSGVLFCGASIQLSRTRWVWSTFSSHFHFPLSSAIDNPQQHQRLIHMKQFRERWESNPGYLGLEASMLTIVPCCPRLSGTLCHSFPYRGYPLKGYSSLRTKSIANVGAKKIRLSLVVCVYYSTPSDLTTIIDGGPLPIGKIVSRLFYQVEFLFFSWKHTWLNPGREQSAKRWWAPFQIQVNKFQAHCRIDTWLFCTDQTTIDLGTWYGCSIAVLFTVLEGHSLHGVGH